MVIVDGMVHGNPYYVEPGKFLVGGTDPMLPPVAGRARPSRGGSGQAMILSGSSFPPCGACWCCPCS